ncbi:N-acetyltransferase [Pseudidiomarina sp.]|uniref:GNAT family N-acetyltransferase n=1 Tax=Pseudidiomarina sp. TaxID=2081707 RepID=UPI00299E8F35|nr:N-acetyltransferase [Pseudidiomarina sp.]MDX1705588.1 N-acetyltransferase [Pseudidiomarina sp.]
MTTAPGWIIRPAEVTDLDQLVALEAATFNYSQIGRRSFRRLLKSPSAALHIALTSEQQLVGYSLLLSRSNSRNWRLYSLATLASTRGTGLGKALLQHAMNYARTQGAGSISLEVKTDNLAAIRLYEKFDFAVIDVLAGYYDEGSDGYRMRHTFPPA